ncbi:MAG: hypothetical protein J7J52_04715 [Deltaproteobacteria bacterium]|nr:hypothetical protein [Deltaproteobacteria bacterium]
MANKDKDKVLANALPDGLERIPVKATSEGKVVGTGTVVVPVVGKVGLKYLKANLTLRDVKDIRRQRVTDALNALRRRVSKKTLLAKALAGDFGREAQEQAERLVQELE